MRIPTTEPGSGAPHGGALFPFSLPSDTPAEQFAGWLPHAYLQGPLWHAHEMLFGFALAVIVGFLFTAGRNWTNEATPTGWPLALLALLWLVARVLVLTPWAWAEAMPRTEAASKAAESAVRRCMEKSFWWRCPRPPFSPARWPGKWITCPSAPMTLYSIH